MTDSDIADSISTELDGDVIDEELREATLRLAQQKERILALALLRGYDGVDITFTNPHPQRHYEYVDCIDWEGWKGEPEPLEPYASGTQRYDFRVLRDHEKEQLLAHAGVFSVEDIQDE
jgi:hypothetical protein